MGELCIIAPKLGEDVCFHPSCFSCSECDELLVDLTYCVRDDILYCERHYAEQIKPRCAACDEVRYFITFYRLLWYVFKIFKIKPFYKENSVHWIEVLM